MLYCHVQNIKDGKNMMNLRQQQKITLRDDKMKIQGQLSDNTKMLQNVYFQSLEIVVRHAAESRHEGSVLGET